MKWLLAGVAVVCYLALEVYRYYCAEEAAVRARQKQLKGYLFENHGAWICDAKLSHSESVLEGFRQKKITLHQAAAMLNISPTEMAFLIIKAENERNK